ncbi:MAG: hypothetical protein HRT73_00380, partial [Flavobacteriales bacterium]|nr:hypothetical protein [Flavobacteriales bacterium]
MKKIITLLMAIAFCSIVIGQQTMIWKKTWSTNVNDVTVGMVTDASNNIYTAGIVGNGTDDDVVITKHDECGVLLWQKTYDSGTDDEVIGIDIDNAGNIYLAGNRDIAVQKKPLILKYSSAGTLIWGNASGVIWGREIRAMTVDGAGNVYTTGSSFSDIFVKKINSSGVQQWLKYYDAGQSLYDEGNDIHLSGNSVYVTGSGVVTSANGTDIVTLKYYTSGTFQWAKTTGGTLADYGVIVKTDAGGNVYVLGSNETATAARFVYNMTKYNVAGTVQWNTALTLSLPNNVAIPSDFIIDNANNTYLTGVVSQTIPSTTTPTSMLTIKLNATGTKQWTKISNSITTGNGRGFGKRLFFDQNGDILVFGRTASNGIGFITYSPSGVQGNFFSVSGSSSKLISAVQSNQNGFFVSCPIYDNGIYYPSIVKIGEFPIGFQAHTYSTTSFCDGDSLQLNATVPTGSTFSWSPTTELSDSTSLTPWVSWVRDPNAPSDKRIYTLTLNNCEAVASVTVTNKRAPYTYIRQWAGSTTASGSLGVITSNDTISACPGDTIFLGGINNQIYDWFKVNNSGVDPYITTTSGLSGIVPITNTGTYYADVNRSGCWDTTVYLTVNFINGSLLVNANVNQTSVCAGTQITFTGSGDGSSYSWDNGVTDGVAFTPTTTQTYTVTGTDGNCSGTDTVTVTVNTEDSGFSYPLAAYCSLGADPTATSNTAGGTYTAPSAVVINAVSGVIDLSASTVGGPYSVTYTTNGACPSNTSHDITITTSPTVVANATLISVCSGTSVTFTGSGNANSYSWNNGVTDGVPFILTSTQTYTVTGTDGNGCSGTDMIIVYVTPMDDAGFTYPSGTYCQTATDPTPTAITGVGTYTAPSGVVINATTGVIDLSASTVGGPYSITYTTSGAFCPNSSSNNVTITLGFDAEFSYTTYCQGTANPFPSHTTGSNGVYNESTGNLVFVNSSTGEIDLASSTPGTYTIINTIAASGGCLGATSNSQITINPSPTVVANTTLSTVCVGSTVTFTGSGASSYAWSNSVTDGQSFTPISTQTYTITGTDGNGCSGTDAVTVTVNPLPTVTA